MKWTLEFRPRAYKQLQGLSSGDRLRILRFLDEKAAGDVDPRQYAKRLAGQTEALWRFRVGDFRIIVMFENKTMLIVVVGVGNRREIYR